MDFFCLQILNNSEFNSSDKFNKPYKLAGVICDYFGSLNKYFDIYFSQVENLKVISDLNEQINKHKDIISKLNEKFKQIDNQIMIVEKEMSNDEILRNNIQNQIDRIQNVNKEMKIFLEKSTENNEIWKINLENINQIINFFDYYIIFISAYITYAPVLNKSYRSKFQNFIYALIESSLEEKINDEKLISYDFIPLILNFLDETNEDKELCIAMKMFNDYIQENLVFMNIFKNKEIFIIDYYYIAKDILSSFLEFSKMKNIINVQFNTSSNEFKEKFEKALKIGQILFIENVSEINQIYYYFFDYINHRFFGDKHQKILKFENKKLEIHEDFKLIFLKNNINKENMKIDSDIFSNMLIINFNINRGDIKWNLFNKISRAEEEKLYLIFKKQKIELIKEYSKKKEFELKMMTSILQMDLSGNVDKIQNMKNVNEKYLNDCQSYENCIEKINQIEKLNNLRKYHFAKKFDLISNDSSIVYKWLSRFFIFNNLYIFKFEYFCDIIIEFLISKRKKKESENKKK